MCYNSKDSEESCNKGLNFASLGLALMFPTLLKESPFLFKNKTKQNFYHHELHSFPKFKDFCDETGGDSNRCMCYVLIGLKLSPNSAGQKDLRGDLLEAFGKITLASGKAFRGQPSS